MRMLLSATMSGLPRKDYPCVSVKGTVLRDGILFVFGLVGIAYQTVTRDVNIPLLISFISMVGVPGVAHTISVIHSLVIGLSQSSSASRESSLEYGKRGTEDEQQPPVNQ